MKKLLLASVVAAVMAPAAVAEITLPSVIGSNMVLQRNDSVALWGGAKPDSKVTVTTGWDDNHYTVKADAAGKWSLKVATGEAGGPYTLTISDGAPAVTLDNILLGEVWICSGQSNMEMPVKGFPRQPTENAPEAISRAGKYPQLRLFTVPMRGSDTPQDSCGGRWLESTPKTVADFSATAYYFGRTLSDLLDIPIGLINTSYGGSTIEAWMTRDAIDSVEGADHHVFDNAESVQHRPTYLWNAMLLPIMPYTAKGFIWYQGESNLGRWMDYDRFQNRLISLWRDSWNRPDMPFYLTQIAQFRYGGDDKVSVPLLIGAQYASSQATPHTGVAATTDIGNPVCIHPSQKREVGERLAWLALANDYGIEGLPAPAPTYKSMRVEDGKAIVSLNNTGSGNNLTVFNNNGWISYEGFEIAGADRVWHPATARIVNGKEGDEISVSSEEVAEPVAVRYAFRNVCPQANVHTVMGQPLAPFRTDNWDIPAEQL